jgi:hypothetical protein
MTICCAESELYEYFDAISIRVTDFEKNFAIYVKFSGAVWRKNFVPHKIYKYRLIVLFVQRFTRQNCRAKLSKTVCTIVSLVRKSCESNHPFLLNWAKIQLHIFPCPQLFSVPFVFCGRNFGNTDSILMVAALKKSASPNICSNSSGFSP